MAGRFPKAYVNEAKKDEALMQYIPVETMGIGARKSGLPKGIKVGGLGVEHVGGTAGGSK